MKFILYIKEKLSKHKLSHNKKHIDKREHKNSSCSNKQNSQMVTDEQLKEYLRLKKDPKYNEPHEFSERSQRNMLRIVSASRFNINLKKACTGCICLVICAFVVGMSSTAGNPPEIRPELEDHQIYGTFNLEDIIPRNSENINNIEKAKKPNYVPKRYELNSEKSYKSMHLVSYINTENEDSIIYNQTTNTSVTKFDTENAKIEKLAIDDMSMYFISKNESNILVWFDKNYNYSLIGRISKEEMIKMAKSNK